MKKSYYKMYLIWNKMVYHFSVQLYGLYGTYGMALLATPGSTICAIIFIYN